MAHQVIWSVTALEDVDAIAAYIARDSSYYAAAVVRRLLTSGRRLTERPHSGRMVPELGDESIRELLVYSYRLIYRVQAQTLTIAAVVHARQSFETGVGRIREHRPGA